MQVTLNELSYVPTIYLRPAEISAVEHLANSAKDKIVPIFLLKPWGNASTIAKAVAKIEGAYEKRMYFLTCDPNYSKEGEPSSASTEFAELTSPANEYESWWTFLADYPLAIPSIPLGGDGNLLSKLIGHADELGRGFLIRLTRESGLGVGPIVEALKSVEHSQYVVCLDVGWGRDILGSELWVDACIKALVDVDDQIKIVVSGSSFPREFSKFGTFGEESTLERILYLNLVKKNNQAKLIYGDWGSSRSSISGGGGVIIPRVDVPRARSWYIFRAANEAGTYQATAKAAFDSNKWEYDPDVWGKYVIRNTSLGQGYVIDSPKKSTEVRINIHLSQQIDLGSPPAAGAVEEDFVD